MLEARLARLLGRLRLAAEGGRSKAEGGRSRAEGGRSKAEGGRSKAEGGRSKADGGRSPAATDAGRGMPKERRLILLSRRFTVGSDAASETMSAKAPKLLLGLLILLLVVTEVGRWSFISASVLGEFFGVLSFGGPGSLDRAECTRSSIFCILPRRLRIW